MCMCKLMYKYTQATKAKLSQKRYLSKKCNAILPPKKNQTIQFNLLVE